MGLRYQKRINLGNGLGLNVSKSGIGSSIRGDYGSIGSKAFSIRTGIPGLTYRGGWGSSKKGNDAIISLMVWFFIGAFVLSTLIIYNLIRFIIWSVKELYLIILRYRYKKQLLKNSEMNP